MLTETLGFWWSKHRIKSIINDFCQYSVQNLETTNCVIISILTFPILLLYLATFGFNQFGVLNVPCVWRLEILVSQLNPNQILKNGVLSHIHAKLFVCVCMCERIPHFPVYL